MKTFLIIATICLFISAGTTRCTKQSVIHDTDTLILKIHDTTTIYDTTSRTLVVQPGPDDGQDCLVSNLAPWAVANLSHNPDISASQWTYAALGYGEATTRTYIEFVALDGLAAKVHIRSAKLYLYGLSSGLAMPNGNSDFPGSPYGSVGNSCWLKRVLTNWNQDSIEWNNMPPTTDSNRVTVPASTSQFNYNATVDVTPLVQDIVNTGHNYGFCLQQKTEQIYRGVNFAGSRNPDSTRWPKLEVTWSLH